MSVEDEILDELAGYAHDPLGFVMFAFPWGEPGELQDKTGPEPWQRKFLENLSKIDPEQALLEATASGHGVGKSCLVSWIILWALATFPDTRGVVTANTEVQLKTKTWAELAKWFRMFIGRGFFRLEATCIFSRDREHEKTWRVDMVPWSEKNTEAFAGLHNQGRRILVVFDEASAIPTSIWETTQGALTDDNTEILWAVFGNPTRNDTRFKQCFPGGMFAHRWHSRTVDSREVSFTDKAEIARWISDYGEDDDFVRVRVKGEFPRSSWKQFISEEDITNAMTRDVETFEHDPVVLGVDVARFGGAESVIYVRQGRDARSVPPIRMNGWGTMEVASKVVETVAEHHADAVFIDGGGVGGGVIDRCRQLGLDVFEIQFGAKPDSGDMHAERHRYFNKRAQIWGSLRDWLKFGAIPNDNDLRTQLINMNYKVRDTGDDIQLQAKADLETSPDIADALAVTFGWPILPRATMFGVNARPAVVEYEYDPFEGVA